jgi:hypothetical protein
MGALLADFSSLDNHTKHDGIAFNTGGAIYICYGMLNFQIFPAVTTCTELPKLCSTLILFLSLYEPINHDPLFFSAAHDVNLKVIINNRGAKDNE